MEIRPVRIEEYEMMLKVWDDSGLSYRPEGRDSREEIERQIREFGDLILGAYEENEMVGVVIGTDDGRKGWINRLAVSPGHRRKGVATELVRVVEDAIRKRGRRIISILIEPPNEASYKLFEKAGYVIWEDMGYMSKRESEKT